MKVKSAQFDGDYLRIVFEHETGDVTKYARVCGYIAYEVAKRTVEAERDIAYRMFGDDWPNRVTRRGQPDRESLIKSVMTQLDAIFPVEALAV